MKRAAYVLQCVRVVFWRVLVCMLEPAADFALRRWNHAVRRLHK